MYSWQRGSIIHFARIALYSVSRGMPRRVAASSYCEIATSHLKFLVKDRAIISVNRRQFLAAAASSTTAFALTARAQSQPASQPTTGPATQPATKPSDIPGDLIWHDVRDWGLEGRAFDDTENYFDRLPGRARGVVRDEVWNLSRHTAGFWSHFQTDASSIFLRYELLNDMLAMAHMPASGVSGVDLYAKLDTGWSFVAAHLPRGKSVEAALIRELVPGFRAYRVHLPLYNGVKSMQIGLPKDSSFAPVAPGKQKPILFYGTSITQGGCASRPGLAFTNILSRRLDRTILNFGFSGNGRMEPEVMKFLVELDPSIFVIDCLANVSNGIIRERLAPLVTMIREAHPQTSILVLDERTWSNADVAAALSGPQEEKRKVLREETQALINNGVPGLHYREGRDLLGDDTEGTVDGSHPNDLGMMRYAEALEPTLRGLMK